MAHYLFLQNSDRESGQFYVFQEFPHLNQSLCLSDRKEKRFIIFNNEYISAVKITITKSILGFNATF